MNEWFRREPFHCSSAQHVQLYNVLYMFMKTIHCQFSFIVMSVPSQLTMHLYIVHVHENDSFPVVMHSDVCAFTTYHLYFLMVQRIIGLCLYNKSAKCASYVMARESHSYGLECSDDIALYVRPYLIP